MEHYEDRKEDKTSIEREKKDTNKKKDLKGGIFHANSVLINFLLKQFLGEKSDLTLRVDFDQKRTSGLQR